SILNTGNVGIGTTSPSHLLTVAGDINATGALRFNGDSGTAGQVLLSTGSGAPEWVATSSLGITGSNWTLSNGNVYRATGSVSIGTTSASSLLNLASTTTSTGTLGLNQQYSFTPSSGGVSFGNL